MALDQSGFAPSTPFVGIIESTHDALICFEAARRSIIPRITRRLLETEKASLIQSGAVFVFDEKESSIKRWTDGLIWSPSRILSNFLIYRETTARTDRHHPNLNPPHRSARGSPLGNSEEEGSDDVNEKREPLVAVAPRRRVKGGGWTGPVEGASEQERERELVGSLTSTYKFKKNGLIKKTISVSINGVAQHLVSYYTMEDALSGRLRSPSSFPELASLAIHLDFLSPSHFRFAPRVEIVAGITRYIESDESIPPPRTNFISVASESPNPKIPSPPTLPRKRSNSFPPSTNIKPLIFTSPLSQVVAGSYFPPTNAHPSSSTQPSTLQNHYIPPASSLNQSYQSPHLSHPQPQRQRSCSNRTVATNTPQFSAWDSIPSTETTSQNLNSYETTYQDQDMGNENGKWDRGPVGSWNRSEQQTQPPRPCFLTQSSTDSFSHLGYTLPSPSHRPATLFYISAASPRPLITNQRLMEAIPQSSSLSSSNNTTPLEPYSTSPPFSYASSSSPSSYQESHLPHQFYHPPPTSHSTRPLPNWTTSPDSPHFSMYERGQAGSPSCPFEDGYAQQGGGAWEVPNMMAGQGTMLEKRGGSDSGIFYGWGRA